MLYCVRMFQASYKLTISVNSSGITSPSDADFKNCENFLRANGTYLSISEIMCHLSGSHVTTTVISVDDHLVVHSGWSCKEGFVLRTMDGLEKCGKYIHLTL